MILYKCSLHISVLYTQSSDYTLNFVLIKICVKVILFHRLYFLLHCHELFLGKWRANYRKNWWWCEWAGNIIRLIEDFLLSINHKLACQYWILHVVTINAIRRIHRPCLHVPLWLFSVQVHAIVLLFI